MRATSAALGLACAAAVWGGTAQVAPAEGPTSGVRPIGAGAPLGDEQLSDELRVTRYAGAVARVLVRAAPRRHAPPVGRLRYLTEDGTFEVYPVLESRVDDGGRKWVRVRLPMRPNGRTGWVDRDALGPLRAVRTHLRVDRATLRATLFRDGRRVWSSPVGVGASLTPTPAGRFWIRNRLRGLGGGSAYGPYAFGTGAYSVLSDWPGGGVIGIHGTNQPGLIPGRPSRGCVRVPNGAVKRLWKLMPVGTPVRIV